MKNQRGNADALILFLIVAFLVAIAALPAMLNPYECRVYGEETGRVTKYKRFRGGCYVQMENGKWRQRDEVRSREEFEE